VYFTSTAGEAQANLRHHETVGVMHDFAPLAPLHKYGIPISGREFYQVALTDW